MDSATTFLCVDDARHRRLLSRPSRVLLTLLATLLAAGMEGFAQIPPKPASGEIFGTVKSGNMAVPGTTVTATDSDNGTHVSTTSNPEGHYVLAVPAGDYTVEAEMTAFATASREVVISNSLLRVQADFDLVLQSRVSHQPGGALAGMGREDGRGGALQAMLAANGDEGGSSQADQAAPTG